MGDSRYKFRSVWQLHAPPDDVFRALARLADYPLWWPEIKTVRALGDDSFELVCKSTLPYELRFTTRQTVRDPDARILEAHMEGDLEGFSRWSLSTQPTGRRRRSTRKSSPTRPSSASSSSSHGRRSRPTTRS